MNVMPEQQGQNEAQSQDSILHVLDDAKRVVEETQVDFTSAKQGKLAWTVPSGKPKRPQSAYNIYFQVERENIINGEDGKNYTIENIGKVADDHYWQSKMPHPKRKHRRSHGKISFGALAKVIADRWKVLDVEIKQLFEERGNFERERYKQDLENWTNKKLRGGSEFEESSELDDNPTMKPKASSPRAQPEHSLVWTNSSPVATCGLSEQPRGVVTPGSDTRDVESFMPQKMRFGNESISTNLPFQQTSSELHSSGQGINEPTSCCANSSGDIKLGQTQSLSVNSSSLPQMMQPWPWAKKSAFNLCTESQALTPRQKVSHRGKKCIPTGNRISLEALADGLPGEPISAIFWPVNNSIDDEDLSDVSSLSSDEDAVNFSDKEIHIADMIAPSIDTNDDDEVSVISISCIN